MRGRMARPQSWRGLQEPRLPPADTLALKASVSSLTRQLPSAPFLPTRSPNHGPEASRREGSAYRTRRGVHTVPTAHSTTQLRATRNGEKRRQDSLISED